MREHKAVGKGRMTVEPELDEGRRIGVRQIDFAQHLECMRSDFRRVGNNAVDDLDAIDIRLVFLQAAEGISNRIEDEH